MHRTYFYKLNDNYFELLKDDKIIVGNLLNNLEQKNVEKQISLMLKKIDFNEITAILKDLMKHDNNINFVDNIIHFSSSDCGFEQIIIYDYYICYDYSDNIQYLLKLSKETFKNYVKLEKSLVNV